MKNPKGVVGPTGGRPKHLGPKPVNVAKVKVPKEEETMMTVNALREVKKP